MAWKSAKDALFHPTHSPRRLFLQEEDRQYRWHAGHTVSDPDLRSRPDGGSLVASKSGPLLASGEDLKNFHRESHPAAIVPILVATHASRSDVVLSDPPRRAPRGHSVWVIRLPSLKQAGVQVHLGLDGGTNDTSDMFNNMRAALGLQRATSLRADIVPTVTQVLRMATVDGATLLNMSDRTGSLTTGKEADLIILDPRAVNFAPRIDAISRIVLNAQPLERRVGVHRRTGGQTEREAGRGRS